MEKHNYYHYLSSLLRFKIHLGMKITKNLKVRILRDYSATHGCLPMQIDKRHFRQIIVFFRCPADKAPHNTNCRNTNLEKKWLTDFLYGGESSIFGISQICSKLVNLVLNLAVTFNIRFFDPLQPFDMEEKVKMSHLNFWKVRDTISVLWHSLSLQGSNWLVVGLWRGYRNYDPQNLRFSS